MSRTLATWQWVVLAILFFTALFCIALVIIVASQPALQPAILTHLQWSAPATPTPSPTATTPAPTSTLTPFQPLPTSTPTLTPTATFTPSPTATRTPRPTRTPKPTRTPTHTPNPQSDLPDSAAVVGITGYAQLYTLDCEARSAVDWAAFWGYSIDEMEFLDGLPVSDNPEVGYVGPYTGANGQIPPNPYGVHAAPIAARLRAYGVPAEDVRGLSWKKLRREIAAGRPVIVWVIYGIAPGIAQTYTVEDGSEVTVAAYEHTVIVTAYDDTYVTILDGALSYQHTIEEFRASWSVLGNMAVIYSE